MDIFLLRGIRIYFAVTLLILVGSISVAGTPNRMSSNSPEIIPGVLYVKFKHQSQKNVQSSASYASIYQKYLVREATQPFMKVARSADEEEYTRIFKFIVPQSIDITRAVRELRNDPNIEYAEPSYVYHTFGYTPNDPSYGLMYNLAKINAPAAWDVTKGDTNVVIGIVDSGTDYNHEDLAANIWTNPGESGNDANGHDKRTNGIDDDNNGFVDDWHGWDFVGANTDFVQDNDPHPKDGNPHGTHTAGTASAVSDNGKGISSIGFKCKLMITKHGVDVAGSNGIYFGFDGILYCVNNGANIVSNSWGGGGGSEYEQDVVRYALKKNVLIVAAAGNGGADQIGDDNEIVSQYPANYRGVLAVGATDSQDKIASFSNYGRPEFVRVFAPGVEILSTVPSNGYDSSWSGTSMATPLVSGLAGLLKAKHPIWTAAQIMFQICGTADNVDGLNPAFAGKMGYGRINAGRALTETPPAPLPEFAFGSVIIDDASGGNNNGILEPGESANLIVSVRNNWGDASNVTATLATNHWAPTLSKNSSSYGLVRGLNVVDSSLKSNASDPFTVSISPDAVPSVIPFTVTFAAAGGYTKQFSFSVAISPQILLVDDDDGNVNVESYYTSALQSLGAGYDVWDHAKNGPPPPSLLSKYGTVIWFCEWAFPALDSTDRATITTYLNGGGRLFLSGQDLGWDLADPAGTEFLASGGASKTFLENVIKAKFINDDAGTTEVAGVVNDSIGDGISFSRYLAHRAASEQYPDVIQPVNGSSSSFNYSAGAFAGQSAGIRYNGAYKVVYLSFGGIEAITDSAKRVLVLDLILRWLGGYKTVVDKLKDTEDTSNPLTVTATVSSTSAVQSAVLYYDNDGAFPFKKTTMTLSAGKYTGAIPAQAANTNIEYFVLVKTAIGYLPYLTSKFHVGPDVIPPQILVSDLLRNSLKLKGPYTIVASVTDNLKLDTNSVTLHYSVNGPPESTAKLSGSGSPDTYQATFQLSTSRAPGDVVSYYITAQDLATVKNTAQFPSTGTKSFIVGRETVDDFEDTTKVLWNYGTWGFTTKFRHTPGSFDITDSPNGSYPPNSDNSLTLLKGFDLTEYTEVQLQYYYKCFVDPSDTLFIEFSKDGNTWVPLKKRNGIGVALGSPAKDNFTLSGFAGAGSSNVRVRFRLLADAAGGADGFYLDDVELIVVTSATSAKPESDNFPSVFSMDRNYPNPFNPTTTIKFGLPEPSYVTLRIYDIVGREVALLVNGQLGRGYYHHEWNAAGMASGVYLCRIEATAAGEGSTHTFSQVNKLLLIK